MSGPISAMQPDDPLLDKVEEWAEHLNGLGERIGSRFPRSRTCQHAIDYIRALISEISRKNSWNIAEACGHRDPYTFQNLISRAAWDHDGVRDELQSYVKEELSTDDDILVLDETGFIKSGDESAGVQRQYTGTAGKITNCQIGVFLTLVTPNAQVIIDRELYMPKSWVDAPARLRKARVPEDLLVDTKGELGVVMVERALTSGFTPSWVLGDSVYGSCPELRTCLEDAGRPYILGVRSNHVVVVGEQPRRASELVCGAEPSSWKRFAEVTTVSRGPRMYEWLYVPIEGVMSAGFSRGLLVRRHLMDATDLVYYLVFSLNGTDLSHLASVEGARWGVERCFLEAKGHTGLDAYQVRTWPGWYRHITLSMLAYAFLAVTRQTADAEGGKKGGLPVVSPRSSRTALSMNPPRSMAAFLKNRGLSSD